MAGQYVLAFPEVPTAPQCRASLKKWLPVTKPDTGSAKNPYFISLSTWREAVQKWSRLLSILLSYEQRPKEAVFFDKRVQKRWICFLGVSIHTPEDFLMIYRWRDVIYGLRRMIYLLRKHEIISVPSYAKGIYHRTKCDIISKIYHPFRRERISLQKARRSVLFACMLHAL